jgi:DNA-binding response OmpR family regulator
MKTPANRPLKNARILVAEDDAILALDLTAILREAGAEVVGLGVTLKQTLSLVKTPHLSAAVLDVNLRDEDVFPAAFALEELGVSIVFYTACTGAHEVHAAWPKAQIVVKPASARLLIEAVRQACEIAGHSRATPALSS